MALLSVALPVSLVRRATETFFLQGNRRHCGHVSDFFFSISFRFFFCFSLRLFSSILPGERHMWARLLPLLYVSWHVQCDDFATQPRSTQYDATDERW